MRIKRIAVAVVSAALLLAVWGGPAEAEVTAAEPPAKPACLIQLPILSEICGMLGLGNFYADETVEQGEEAKPFIPFQPQ